MAETKQLNWRLIILGGFLVFAVWAGSGGLIWYFCHETVTYGIFGDMFGAINALFSGWAFLGLIFAIILQKQQLEEQRHEIMDQRIAQQQSADTLQKQFAIAQFSAEIEAFNHIIVGYDRRIDRLNPNNTIQEKEEHDRLMKEREQFEVQLQQSLKQYFQTIGER